MPVYIYVNGKVLDKYEVQILKYPGVSENPKDKPQDTYPPVRPLNVSTGLSANKA